MNNRCQCTSVSEGAPDGEKETTVLAYKDHGDHKPHKGTSY